jgi:integrase
MKGTCAKENEERMFFVAEEPTQRVLAACATRRQQLIFALARYGGLRCPSEHIQLRWGDIDWDNLRFTVHSPKTEHHAGKASRVCPLFDELLPYLRAAYDDAHVNGKPPKGDTYLIDVERRDERQKNWGPEMGRIVKRAGITPWPKIFQNLRSTRETELLDQGNPLKDVCKWLGNTEAVALKHYVQARDESLRKAVGKREVPLVPVFQKSAAKSAALTDGNISQWDAAMSPPNLPNAEIVESCEVFPSTAGYSGNPELPFSSSGRT